MYDPTMPPVQDLTDLAWALWTARTASEDVSNPPIWVDAQWEAMLAITATTRVISTVTITYYRPFEAAARFIVSPSAVTKRRVGEIDESYVDPISIAEQLRAYQTDLDAAIPNSDATEAVPLRCFLGDWE